MTVDHSVTTNQRKITKLHDILSRFKRGKKLKVLLLGAYGSANVGDLAILDAMLEDLSEDSRISYSVPSRDLFLKENYDINMIDPFTLRGFWQCLKHDVIIVGGGGIFGHETHIHMKLMMPFLFVSKMLRKKLIFYDVGIFKAEKKVMLKILWSIMKYADEIILRDDTDIDIIPKAILKRIKVEPDITFSLEAKEPSDRQIVDFLKTSRNVIGISLRFVNLEDTHNEYDRRIAEAIKKVIVDQFLNKGVAVLFIPFQPIDRSYVEHYLKDVIDEYSSNFVMLETTRFTVNEIKWIIGRLQLAVGMRLHFQIFSHDQNIPFVGIAYAQKNKHFLSKVNAPMVDAYSITTRALTDAIIEAKSNSEKFNKNPSSCSLSAKDI